MKEISRQLLLLTVENKMSTKYDIIKDPPKALTFDVFGTVVSPPLLKRTPHGNLRIHFNTTPLLSN